VWKVNISFGELTLDNRWWLLLIPAGVAALYFLSKDDEPANPSAGKEAQFLNYNKDEFFKGIIQTEGHFRNGAIPCCVKHLADCEGHCDEGVSHALIAESSGNSEKWKSLRDNTRDFRHDLQAGKITPEQGIEQARMIRHQFESFNPEYDISKCEACEV